MDGSGIRLVLVAAAAGVLASWVFDALGGGPTAGGTAVALGLVAVCALLHGASHLLDTRVGRPRADSGERSRDAG